MAGEAKLFRCIKAGKIVRFIPPWSNPIEMLEQWARIKPGRPALTGFIGAKQWITRSYCQLLRRVLAAGRMISEQPPERLAIACGAHVSTVEALFAALAARREFVLVDLLRKPLSLQLFKLVDSRATVLVIPALEEMPDQLVDRINEVKQGLPQLKIWSFGENAMAELNLLATGLEGVRLAQIDYPPTAWQDPAALLYSPGRHGQPKGYFYHPSALGANLTAVAAWLKLGPRARMLLATEIDSVDGLIPILAALYAGGTAIVHSHIDSGNFWKIIPECDADMVRAKPALIEELLNDGGRLTSINRSNLKFIITGSAYLPRQIGLRFFETFDLPLLQSYGTAETGGYILGMSPGLSWREYELALRDNIVGQELGLCNVKLRVDSAAADRTTNLGEGILHVRGHVLSSGYWDGEKIQYWAEPWLSTSDMAMCVPWQEQQYYQIRGRAEDTLIIENQRFWPAYIERSMLDTFQFLRDCVAMLLPNPGGKPRLSAVVVLPSDVPAHRKSELMALMDARLKAGGVSGLSERATPKEIIPFDEQLVPRRHDGHPDRHELHRLVTQTIVQPPGMAAS